MVAINKAKGFTLVELLVVILVIGILVAGVTASFSGSQTQARDAQRQSELRELELAIENYRRDNRQYPLGCNGAGQWSGQTGTSDACSCSDELQSDAYICGLMPRYINEIPKDTRAPSGSIGGYMYITDESRSAFKLTAVSESSATTMTACPDYCDCVSENSENTIAVWGGLSSEDSGTANDFACILP